MHGTYIHTILSVSLTIFFTKKIMTDYSKANKIFIPTAVRSHLLLTLLNILTNI